MSISDVVFDMEEIEADRRRNERSRREFLDYYAEWLRQKALKEGGPTSKQKAPSLRRQAAKRDSRNRLP